MRVRGTFLGLTVLVGVAAVAAVAGVASSPHADAGPTGFRGVGRWLTYPDGRVFLPHGVNSVVTSAPYWNDRLGAQDARFLASEGFTAVRLAVLPSALEPRPGTIDTAYLEHFVSQARLLARYGIATLIDVNQDNYSQACGGDGFPAWAVLSSCETAAELSGTGAWSSFWTNAAAADGVGLQDHYLGWLKVLAQRLAGVPGVLGIDLLNEPKVVDEATLGELWQRAIDTAISAGAPGVSFVEPRDPQWPGFDQSFPAGTGFTGHVYCASTAWQELARGRPTKAQIASCERDDAVMLERQLAYATKAGQAYLVGEFGASDELTEQRALVDAMGTHFAPWLVYAYNGTRDSSGAMPQGLLLDDRRHGSEANAKQQKLDALVVPYPLAVAGTPSSWRFDRTTRVVHFRYSTQRAGGGSLAAGARTVVFVPQRVYRQGYAVQALGARVVSARSAPWLELVARPGAKTVTVTIRPTRTGKTLTPLQSGRCGFDLHRCA